MLQTKHSAFLVMFLIVLSFAVAISCGDTDETDPDSGSEHKEACRHNCEEEYRCLEIPDEGWIDTCADACVMMFEYGTDSDKECIQCYLDCRKDYDGDCDAQQECILDICGRMQEGGPCP